MKNIFPFLLLTVLSLFLNAEVPQSMNYQAVARDASGNALINHDVRFRFTILNSYSGTVEYIETDSVRTNSFGLATVIIGNGTVVTGSIDAINWGSIYQQYLKVEMDATGGTNYTNMGMSQLVSVPYALHAAHAETSGDNSWLKNGSDIYNSNTGNVGIGITSPNSALQIVNTGGYYHTVAGIIPVITGADISNTATTSYGTAGIYAYANNSSAHNYGVLGEAGGSAQGQYARNYGVFGIAKSASTAMNIGVYGEADSSTYYSDPYNSIGVLGSGFHANSVGVLGQTQDGAAGWFRSWGAGYGLIVQSGNVGIGTITPAYMLEVNGTAAKPGGGSWTATSDARMKQSVMPYTDGLSAVMAIKPVRYHYNKLSGHDTKLEYVGVIAQELKKIAPYMVGTFKKDETEYYNVNNSAMTYMLINGMKEQQKMIDMLKKEIEELKKR